VACCMLAALTLLVYQLAIDGPKGTLTIQTCFFMYTNITFLLMLTYFVIGTTLSWKDWKHSRRYSSLSAGESQSLSVNGVLHEKESELRLHHKAFWVLFQICFTSAVFLDIVFWSLIFHPPGRWNDFVFHGANSIFIGVELAINSIIFVPSHVYFQFIYILIYAVLAFSYYGVTHVWLYGFLNWYDKLFPIYYVVALLLPTCIFFIGYLLTRLRDGKIACSRTRHSSPAL